MVRLLFSLGNTKTLDLLEASSALVNYHHTDGAGPIFLLAWEHGAKVHKNPESPKSSSKNPCLSGFQAGQTVGNVKTAEIRSKGKTNPDWYLYPATNIDDNSTE